MAFDSSVAAVAPAGRASTFILDTPPTVYQTRLVDGKQDNATPQILRIQLCDVTFKAVVAAAAPLSDVVFGVIRRADGREVEVFDEATASFLGLRVPQATFEYSLTKRGVLEIRVHRKELPVSIAHGFSPFKLIFAVGLPSAGVVELVETAPFMIASKEPKPRPARPPPKRVRAPPPRRPVAAPAVGREAEINQMLAAPAAVAVAVAQEDHIDADVAVPRKRGRAVKAPAPVAIVAPAPVAPAPVAPAPAPVAPSVMDAPPSPVAAILGDTTIGDLPSPFGLDFDLGAAIAAEFAADSADAAMDAIVLPLAL